MANTPFVLARIKTPDKRKGHLVRRYTYQGKRFDCDNGWYKVGRGMGDELAKLKNPSTDTFIFDIVELEEAEEIDHKESNQEWARGARRPEDAPAVKVGDFKRRKEIKEEVALREADTLSDSDWDDTFDPQNDFEDGEAEAIDEEPEPAPEPKKAAAKKTTKKKSSRRRSSTK